MKNKKKHYSANKMIKTKNNKSLLPFVMVVLIFGVAVFLISLVYSNTRYASIKNYNETRYYSETFKFQLKEYSEDIVNLSKDVSEHLELLTHALDALEASVDSFEYEYKEGKTLDKYKYHEQMESYVNPLKSYIESYDAYIDSHKLKDIEHLGYLGEFLDIKSATFLAIMTIRDFSSYNDQGEQTVAQKQLNDPNKFIYVVNERVRLARMHIEDYLEVIQHLENNTNLEL